MNRDKEKELLAKYPLIFSHVRCLECGPGWFPIIDELCHKIQMLVNSGMMSQIVATQVKEKFGGLRFYCMAHNPVVDDLILDAEEKCSKICEVCGEPGTLETDGWLRVTCTAHRRA